MGEDLHSSYSYETRGERRQKRRDKRRYGMQVDNTSIKVLATIIPKEKRRKRKKGKR
jgi:hypothetical protein